MSHRKPGRGLLLVGHGTQSAIGTKQFLALAQQLARRAAPADVEPAFLEMQEPGIDEGVERLLARGVERLVVAPVLLFAAGHAKRDIPEAVRAALARCGRGDLPWRQTAHLGCHPAILELSQRRMAEAVNRQWSGVSRTEAAQTCLLLVGRGSLDESATTEMQEFARLRQQLEGGMRTEVAFLAMARPLLGEKLAELTSADFQRVIVQPHLLFEGELAESLRQQVAHVAGANPGKDWPVTPLLADALGEAGAGTELLVEALQARWDESEADWPT